MSAFHPLRTFALRDIVAAMITSNSLRLGLVLVALAWAGPARADGAYSHCIERSSGNLQQARCGEAYLWRLEVALNAAWKRTEAALNTRSRKELLEEQRAWLKFRDSSCLFWANGSFGRDGQVIRFFECRAAITAARVSDLNRVAKFVREHQ
jgi:uncharacterized protein YecT (DUF1311 family)